MSWRHLFSRSLAADPERLHFAAHSHHLWPDASYDGHVAAWQDAAALADHKWDKVMGSLWSEAQQHVADELKLPDPATLCFAPNTHDFIVRLLSAIPARPVRVLASDGEFHSFRRQMTRWVEAGEVILETASPDGLLARARTDFFDLIFASHVLFNSGEIISDLDSLAAMARPEGPWVVIDGYHGFMALETDLSPIAEQVFYLAGGYKYAMAGEGACFLHAPPGYAERPVVTGWYAAFDDLVLSSGDVGYASDGRRFLGSTFDPSGLYRFNAVQNMLNHEGLTTAVISNHVADLQMQFLESGPLGDFELINPLGDRQHARFLAFRGESAAALHDSLAGQNVVVDVRGDVLRIGFGLYHDREDVERLTEIIGHRV